MRKLLPILCGVILLILLCINLEYAKEPEKNKIKVPDDYATIQDAVNAAEDGDTIKIKPGEYEGAFISGKHVKIEGSGPTTIITDDNNEPGWAGDAFTIYGGAASGTEIRNLAIDLSYLILPPGWVPVGVDINHTNDVIVRNVEIRNTTYLGIVALLAENVQIIKNNIIGFPESPWGLSAGIEIIQCKNSLLALNKIKSMPDEQGPIVGIFLYSSRRETTGNIVVYNEIAVKTEYPGAAIRLVDRTQLASLPWYPEDEVECEDLFDNLIACNDLHRSIGSPMSYDPLCLADRNTISCNRGYNAWTEDCEKFCDKGIKKLLKDLGINLDDLD